MSDNPTGQGDGAPVLEVADTFVFASNRDWLFAIARLGDRWIGVARSRHGEAENGCGNLDRYLHIMPEVADGYTLGLTERAAALGLASAIAADPESGWGPIERWLIPRQQRGDPDAFRCPECGALGCNGRDCQEWMDDAEPSEPPEPAEPPPELGPCCICEGSQRVVNILILAVKGQVPGHGWGCLVCGLEPDGASAVVCEACWGRHGGTDWEASPELRAALRFACRGYPASDGRVPIGELTEAHEHDMSRHQEGD